MRVLLAGATGVIGRQAVPVLTAAGHQVTGLARAPARLTDAEVVAADALDATAVAGAVRWAAPDVIVHMLTAIPDPVDPRHLARDMALTNRLRTQGTANLLAAAGGARVIAQGVAYAYDPAGSPVKDEDAPLWHHPPSQFAPVVAAADEQERRVTAAGGLVLRLGHLYGPGSSYAPDGGLARRLRGGRLPLIGDGASMFSFIHAHDAATAILAAVDHPAASGVLNVVDDRPTLVHDWLPEMAAMLGGPAPRHVPAWLARLFVGGWGVAYMTGLAGASNAHACQQLDWKPTYSGWRDGLAADLGSPVRR
jgi:nucleoside-diphosphate-sugar epimerase